MRGLADEQPICHARSAHDSRQKVSEPLAGSEGRPFFHHGHVTRPGERGSPFRAKLADRKAVPETFRPPPHPMRLGGRFPHHGATDMRKALAAAVLSTVAGIGLNSTPLFAA